MSGESFKLLIGAICFGAISTTYVVGNNGDPMGYVGCTVFAVAASLIAALLFYEQGYRFRSTLVLTDALDLTFTEELRCKLFNKRFTIRAYGEARAEWLARHSL